jgi:hypothetical protein
MPKQMDEPKKHHYVPAFYLRGWERPETGKLVEFRKLPRKLGTKEVTAQNTGFQKLLYSNASDDAAGMDHTFESEYLSSLDNDGANALRVINEPDPRFTDEVKVTWSRLMVSLMTRSPEDVNAFKKGLEFMHEKPSPMRLRLIASMCKEFDIKTQEAEEVMASLRPPDVSFAAFKALGHLIEWSKLIPVLCAMTWRVRDLQNAKYTLLTSDRPVLNNHELAMPSGLLAMPVSPTRLLILHGSKSSNADHLRYSSGDVVVRSCNQLIVEAARQYVWSTSQDQERFVGNRIGKKKEFSVSEIALLATQKIDEPLNIQSFLKAAKLVGAMG